MKITPFVHFEGTTEFLRPTIRSLDGRYWNDFKKVWSHSPNDATKFKDVAEANLVCYQLLANQFGDQPSRCFVTPMVVQVFGGATREEVYQWLRKAVVFEICYGNYGIGPNENSHVKTIIDWSKFSEVSPKEIRLG